MRGTSRDQRAGEREQSEDRRTVSSFRGLAAGWALGPWGRFVVEVEQPVDMRYQRRLVGFHA